MCACDSGCVQYPLRLSGCLARLLLALVQFGKSLVIQEPVALFTKFLSNCSR